MNREESSVMSSLQQLIVDEDQRRAEQIALAHRRKLEQERELFEQEKRRAELERQRAEAAKCEAQRRAAADRAEFERQERERAFELERVRSELDLRAKVTVMQTEQQHELERLAVIRDQRVTSLEGQRLMVSALLGTIVVGLVLTYVAVVRPELQRERQNVVRLTQGALEQQAERDRETGRMSSQIRELQNQVADLDAKLRGAQRALAEREPKRKHETVTSPPGVRPRPTPETCTDPNDPLCGSLK